MPLPQQPVILRGKQYILNYIKIHIISTILKIKMFILTLFKTTISIQIKKIQWYKIEGKRLYKQQGKVQKGIFGAVSEWNDNIS